MKYILAFSLLLFAMTFYSQDNGSVEVQFLGILTLTEKYKTGPWTESEMATVGEHFKRLMAFNEEGKVVFAGRTQYENNHPDLMGLVVFYAKDLEEAQKFMEEDPAVKGKIMKAKVHPYSIAIGKQ